MLSEPKHDVNNMNNDEQLISHVGINNVEIIKEWLLKQPHLPKISGRFTYNYAYYFYYYIKLQFFYNRVIILCNHINICLFRLILFLINYFFLNRLVKLAIWDLTV